MASDRDEMVLDRIRTIGEEIQSEQPMVGNLNSPTVLLQEYQNNDLPGFIPGIRYL
jgi:uroporphyrinogen-III decarboxylase